MEADTRSQLGSSLKILPAYTGMATLEEILHHSRAVRLLWLEILVNDRLDLTPWQQNVEVQQAFEKACQWYTTYKTLIHSMIPRSPLPQNLQPVDVREYRTFAEALRFATTQP